jgi:hypothetical protein
MHKKEIRELLCAMLIGDGYMSVYDTPGHTAGAFWIEHSSKQLDYLLWKKDQIDTIFRKKGLERHCKLYDRARKDKRTGKTYYTCSLCLSWRSYFKHLYKRIYIRNQGAANVKKVEYLLKNLTMDKHLAIWFMDDGSESRTKAKHIDGEVYYKNPYFRLATQGFTIGEANLIKQWFNSKYSLTPSITLQNNRPLLQFSVKDSRLLFPKIRPYVVQIESMRQKFRICLERY